MWILIPKILVFSSSVGFKMLFVHTEYSFFQTIMHSFGVQKHAPCTHFGVEIWDFALDSGPDGGRSPSTPVLLGA